MVDILIPQDIKILNSLFIKNPWAVKHFKLFMQLTEVNINIKYNSVYSKKNNFYYTIYKVILR